MTIGLASEADHLVCDMAIGALATPLFAVDWIYCVTRNNGSHYECTDRPHPLSTTLSPRRNGGTVPTKHTFRRVFKILPLLRK